MQYVNISNNKLTILANLPHVLVELNMDSNYISKFESIPIFGTQTNLTKLNLSNNGIKTLELN